MKTDEIVETLLSEVWTGDHMLRELGRDGARCRPRWMNLGWDRDRDCWQFALYWLAAFDYTLISGLFVSGPDLHRARQDTRGFAELLDRLAQQATARLFFLMAHERGGYA